MEILGNIKPQNVMKYFEGICNIPHGSGNTDKISDYCIKTAKNLGLYAEKDGMNNLIIKKSGSKGFENHPTVILQAHLDMVCEKTPECEIDFEKDGIPIMVEGDY
ncbi:MAG: aminoacyl-histidine dipeptidase, partial [Acutalibacteraceae bacterium]|nr:aminoacyl-histidine dipeptidase [Acutalibacteraceae bacterium]